MRGAYVGTRMLAVQRRCATAPQWCSRHDRCGPRLPDAAAVTRSRPISTPVGMRRGGDYVCAYPRCGTSRS